MVIKDYNDQTKGIQESQSKCLVFGKFANREEDQLEIRGYQRHLAFTFVTWISMFLTLGVLRLVFHWWPQLYIFATHVKCHGGEATVILVIEHFGPHKRFHVKSVQIVRRDKKENSKYESAQDQESSSQLSFPMPDGAVQKLEQARIFLYKKQRYIWNKNMATFSKLSGLDNAPCHLLHQSLGLSVSEQDQRGLIFGKNEMKVKVQSLGSLLFLEILNPFYVFQACALSLWMSDEYYYYASAVILMSILGVATTTIQTRQNQKKLRSTVESSDLVKVSRGGGIYDLISTQDLVPGDVIVIPSHGCTLYSDAALLSGTCIANESMLTGESVPVTKTPLPNPDRHLNYDNKEHARHTLFSGTQILQTRHPSGEQVLAVVLRTGFYTSKGNLVRSILYPPPADYKFERDSYKFIGVLAGIASVGFSYSLYLKIQQGDNLRDILVNSLELITIVIPPALPAAMTVGRVYAQRRLQQKKIYCISPRSINVAGSIDCVCFDKTGTLTEEGLDVKEILTVKNAHAPTVTPQNGSTVPIDFNDPIKQVQEMSHDLFIRGMAACHSLTRINENLIGDPLDLKMFEWTGWSLEENESMTVRPNFEFGGKIGQQGTKILRQFPFLSHLQRMSVITETNGKIQLYTKGSPEMVASLSLPNSIPSNFLTKLEHYTNQGYRVIALAVRNLPEMTALMVPNIERENVEKDLKFLGFLILENRLKKQTAGVITLLNNAAIRLIMVTGDNLLTGISVARECGLVGPSTKIVVVEALNQNGIPQLHYTTKENKKAALSLKETANIESPLNRYQLAITGAAFDLVKSNYPSLLPRLLVRGAIFARMSPDQKQNLVELLQQIGYYVGMCGDGANDCGALKAAHAGISLSEAEASVASPFTSNDPNITCVPELIRQGRCALVTSFGIFKYMAIYSLIQFISAIILYNIGLNLSDLQYLYIDLCLITVFAIFFGRTKPYSGPLNKVAPPTSLVSPAPIVSLISHVGLILGFQLLGFFYIRQQPWFEPFTENEENEYDYRSHDNYAIFTMSAFQYIGMAIVFSKGRPYRKSLVTNYGLTATLTLMTSFTLYLLLGTPQWAQEENTFQLNGPPSEFWQFRLILVGLAAVNLGLALLIEYGLVDFVLGVKLKEIKFQGGPSSNKEYDVIDYHLNHLTEWPPGCSHECGILIGAKNEI